MRLGTAIDRIEQDMWDERKDSDADRWILSNGEVRLFLTETLALGPKPSVGTCPLVEWHQEVFGGQFRGVYSLGIYNPRAIGGTSTPSQHGFANAEDPAHDDFKVMQAIFDYTYKERVRLKVAHVIFNRKVWSYNNPTIHAYTGENPHTSHVHVDFLPQLSGAYRASTCQGH